MLIEIIIDFQITSFKKLFKNCNYIEYIHFKKFFRNNINNMSSMFFGCSSLKKLNLSHFNTDNVYNMLRMFYGCSFELIKKIKNTNHKIAEKAFV